MQSDIQGLKITPEQLRHLCGTDVQAVQQFSVTNLIRLDIGKDPPKVVRYLPLMVAAAIGATHGILSQTLKLVLPFNLLLLLLELAVGFTIAKSMQLLWVKKNLTDALKGLLQDVEKYNNLLKYIDINDQLEAVGNQNVKVQNREEVISALKLTREELVQALKTERILRKNHYFIDGHPELFSENLTALTALQVSDRAGEHGRLLNEALEIAVGAREEIRKISQENNPSK